MASKELSILLTAKDLASKTIGNVGRNVKKLDSVSSRAGQGMRNLGTSLKRMAVIGGAAGIGLLAVSVKSGIENLAILHNATQSLEGSIKQLGLTGQVSAAQVVGWAGDIETAVGAAFDDKDIAAATSTLLRFGKVTPSNLRPAMQVMTDLAVKTGGVDSAAQLLGKALADPTKAAGKLSRAGVVLTKQQQKQIAAFVKAGDMAAAQKVILDSLAKTTGGAALNSQDKYTRSMKLMGEAVEDAQMALAEGFLPVITRVADWLKKGLSDPGTMSNIRTLGQNLAGAFDKAVTFAQGIDWKSIGDGLKIAADWAGKLFGAFMSMPAEVKGAIIALAGLEKLSGGAVSGIVGELGKGLIKGVLGMNAGVVNINAAVVNGPGGGKGGPDIPGTVGKAVGGGGVLATVGAAGLVTAIGAAVNGALYYGIPAALGANRGQDAKPFQTTSGGTVSGNNAAMFRALGTISQHIDALDPAKPVNDSKAHTQKITQAIDKSRSDTRSEQIATTRGVQAVKAEQARSIVAFRSGERTSQTGLSTVASTTRSGTSSVTAAQSTSASRIVAAVNAAGKPTVVINVAIPGAKVTYSTKSSAHKVAPPSDPNGHGK